MGVQGLASLIGTQTRIYRDLKFRKRSLVIDGCNLLYLLYFDSGLELIRGGEYAAFEDLVERFAKSLKDCGISAYVVLDGGMDLTGKKDETLVLRTKDKIKKATQAAQETRQEKVLPQMAKLVFRQTLARMGVPVAQCYAEADQEIAALAREWRCPVLSNDSDFYIFDLPGGLLPIAYFHWQAGDENGIPCKIYYSSCFCIVFEIRPQILPAFAALAGNDYVKLQRMEASISWSDFAPAANGRPQHFLVGLLHWLKDFGQPKDAFKAALGLMGELSEEQKKKVLKGLKLGMEEYRLPPSSLKKFFMHGVAPPYPEVEEENASWILAPVTQGRLTTDVLDVLLLNSMSLSCFVDRADFPSAHLTSRSIRQVMYRLLLGKDETDPVYEVDREGDVAKNFLVKAAADGVPEELELQSLNKAEPSVRLQVLLGTLGVPEASLMGLQPHWRLPVAATCYWLQNAEPKPDEAMLKALLLGMSHGESLRRRAALRKQKTLFKLQLDADVLHAFNQWQGCLKQSVHLNQLLGFPLPEPQVARCFEGTLVHRLVQMMRTDQKLKNFLRSSKTDAEEYHSMLAFVQRFLSEEGSVLTRAPEQEVEPVKDLTATLKDLFSLFEEDEVSSAVRVHQELYMDHMLSVRTRYRSKERGDRCHSLVLARKQECRGWDVL